MWWKKILGNDTIKRELGKQKNILRGKQDNPLKKAFYIDRFKGVVDSDEENNNKKGEEEKNDDEKLEKLYENNKDSKKTKDLKTNFKQIRELFSKTKMIFKTKKESEEKETLTCPIWEKLRGMPGTKFKFKKINENKYKPWKCITLKCQKFIKYHSDHKKQNEIFL